MQYHRSTGFTLPTQNVFHVTCSLRPVSPRLLSPARNIFLFPHLCSRLTAYFRDRITLHGPPNSLSVWMRQAAGLGFAFGFSIPSYPLPTKEPDLGPSSRAPVALICQEGLLSGDFVWPLVLLSM